MYRDNFGREWKGPYPFEIPQINTQAPQATGIYMVLFGSEPSFQEGYIGIATENNTIRARLSAHAQGRSNWGLGRITQPDMWKFVFFPCDSQTARQIESYVTSTKKPPLNVKIERMNFIPNITVH